MTRLGLTLVYEGPAVDDHGMDAAQLGPSIVALDALLKRTNAAFNADRSQISLRVRSDFEHKCFIISFDILQVYNELRGFLDDEHVRTAKELFEWLGLLATGGGLLSYMIWRNGRKVETSIPSDDSDYIDVNVVGDSNSILIHRHVYMLSQDEEIRQHVSDFVAPLRTPGYKRIQAGETKSSAHTIINKDDADAIGRSALHPPEDEEALEPQNIVAHLQVSQANFSPDAKIWKFKYGRKVISLDVSRSGIPEKVRLRGLLKLDDTWKVLLQTREIRTSNGTFKVEYAIVEVIDFIEGKQQTDLFTYNWNDEENSEDRDLEPPLDGS